MGSRAVLMPPASARLLHRPLVPVAVYYPANDVGPAGIELCQLLLSICAAQLETLVHLSYSHPGLHKCQQCRVLQCR